MATISKTVDVGASPEDSWALLSDLERAGEWNTVHVDHVGDVPVVAEGATFKEKVTVMGMPAEVDWTIKSVEPPSALEMTGIGPMGTTLRAAIAVAANGEGSTITYESEFGGPALAAMEGPLTSASEQAADASLAKVKEILG